MDKEIKLDNNRVLMLIITPGYAGLVRTIQEKFFVNGELKKDYSLSQWDDYGFVAYRLDDIDDNEISFEFDINHPLYFPLRHLLNGDNILIIDDDDTYENIKRYMKVGFDEDKIILSFINDVDEKDRLDLEKFYVFIKNVGFDLRSKIDEQGIDTKNRLINFFNEVVNVLSEEYHQITFEEYMTKRRILKK